MTRPIKLPEPSPLRCAIYTRRSIEPPPHQDLNSLEAQRMICSAYVTSQRHKGWHELSKNYDDAGRSGATLDRPALQELMADIENGLVDVVVVYKIDRITRTLLDFVRLIDFFERHGTAFVSITQNFDTADSMGRLILNVLLTFAQFERELASDRIRDKIRAMKASGRWAGGPAPLGYDLQRRRLHVNEAEAAMVRHMFDRYLELENITAVFEECRRAGYTGKRWRNRAGKIVGGGPITKALVFHVLQNPVYLGELRNNDERFQGLHAPIIDREVWNRVQEVRARQASSKEHRRRENILTDLLFDCFGRPMSVQRGEVAGRSLNASRYYMSRQTAWGKRQQLKRLRARADAIEDLVLTAVRNFIGSREKVRSMLLDLSCHDSELDRLSRRCHEAGNRLASMRRDRLGAVLRALIVRIELSLERVKIILRSNEIERFIRWDGVGLFGSRCDMHGRTYLLDIPACAVRYSRLLTMPVEPRARRNGAHPMPGLRRMIHEARRLQSLVDSERDKTLAELAATVGYTAHRFARVLRLNYLAPDIILSILDGTHPAGLTQTKLVQANLPMDWALQRQLLGFEPRPTPEGSE